MKTKYLLPLLIVFCCVFSSCNKEPNENNRADGNIVFSYKSVSNVSKKALSPNLKQDSSAVETPQAVIVSIIDNFGNVVKNMEEVPLYNMNGNFISKPLSLKKGSYKLSDFLVIDKNGNVLYLTPKEESPKAYLVSDPLPVEFNVSKNEVTKVNVEVLKNTGETPEEYGYSTFTFNVVDVFNFYVSVFTYSDSIQNFQLTNAKIEVYKDSSKIFENELSAITYSISLRKEVSSYTIVIKKNGYQSYSSAFTLTNLQGYTTENPLIIILTKEEFVTNGLVAYYPFNGNANDESGNSHNGTVYEATLTTDRNNKSNSAYEFNGINNYINTFSTFDYEYRTVSFWVYIQNMFGGTQAIISQDSYELKYGLCLATVRNGLITLHGGGTYSSVWYQTNSIIPNQWYHMVMVRNGSTTQYYINNVLVHTGLTNTIGSSVNPNTNFLIGCGRTLTDYFFLGKIDDIAIYNRALSAVEINTIYGVK